MAIVFDGPNKRIILDSADVSAAEVLSRWVDWQALNPQWPLAFSLVGVFLLVADFTSLLISSFR